MLSKMLCIKNYAQQSWPFPHKQGMGRPSGEKPAQDHRMNSCKQHAPTVTTLLPPKWSTSSYTRWNRIYTILFTENLLDSWSSWKARITVFPSFCWEEKQTWDFQSSQGGRKNLPVAFRFCPGHPWHSGLASTVELQGEARSKVPRDPWRKWLLSGFHV